MYDDEAPMTSMARVLYIARTMLIELLFSPSPSLVFSSRIFFVLPRFLFVFLLITIRSANDVSQCVDMKKQDDATTITTAAAVPSGISQ